MPKVVYTAAKGLVQESGSGFEVGGASIVPSTVSHGTFSIDIDTLDAGSGATAANLNTDGAFFILSDDQRSVVFYFTDSDEATPASQPSLTDIRAAYTGPIDGYRAIETSTVTSAADVIGLVETAVEAEFSLFDLIDNTDATFSIEGESPFAPIRAFNKGNLSGTTVTTNNAGLGTSKSYTLVPYGLHFIDADGLDQLDTEDPYVLSDGTIRGQEVTVIMSLDNGETHTMDGKIQKTAATGDVGAAAVVGGLTGQGGTTATFTGVSSNVASLMLQWDGIQWLIKGGHSVDVA